MASTSDTRPALLGGNRVRLEGPPDWPVPDPEVARALEEAYRTGAGGKYHGEFVPRLEARLGGYHAVGFVALCSSGTFAVEIALRALGIEPGDEVLLAAYDYPGNFLAIHAIGAIPVLVDIDQENWNLDVSRL